jgi:hypothetical protein
VNEESILIDFDPNDFLIRLNPMLDEDGYWSGDISVGIVTTPENNLDEEDFDQMMYLTMLVTASLPLMEDSVEFRKALNKYAKKLHNDSDEESPNPKTEKIADNVIKLKF